MVIRADDIGIFPLNAGKTFCSFVSITAAKFVGKYRIWIKQSLFHTMLQAGSWSKFVQLNNLFTIHLMNLILNK